MCYNGRFYNNILRAFPQRVTNNYRVFSSQHIKISGPTFIPENTVFAAFLSSYKISYFIMKVITLSHCNKKFFEKAIASAIYKQIL